MSTRNQAHRRQVGSTVEDALSQIQKLGWVGRDHLNDVDVVPVRVKNKADMLVTAVDDDAARSRGAFFGDTGKLVGDVAIQRGFVEDGTLMGEGKYRHVCDRRK